MHADSSSKRMDEKHLISQRIQLPLPHLADLLTQVRTINQGLKKLPHLFQDQLISPLLEQRHHVRGIMC